MGVSIYSVKYNFFLFSLTIPFFQKNDFSEGKSGLTAFFCYRGMFAASEKPEASRMKNIDIRRGNIIKNPTLSPGPRIAFQNR